MTPDPAHTPGTPEWIARRALERELASTSRLQSLADSLAPLILPEGGTGAGLRWMGPYQSDVDYAVNDVVRYDDMAWVCLVDAPAGSAPSFDTAAAPSSLNGGGTATRLQNGVAFSGTAPELGRWFFADVVEGGSLTFHADAYGGAYNYVANPAGTVITNGMGDRVVTATPGRWWFYGQASAGSGTHDFSAVLSGAAETSPPQWDYMVLLP